MRTSWLVPVIRCNHTTPACGLAGRHTGVMRVSASREVLNLRGSTHLTARTRKVRCACVRGGGVLGDRGSAERTRAFQVAGWMRAT